MARNVIIDTDPGIDDAMGLMMALEAHTKGQINIVAFTLAAGNCTVANGIKNISAVLSFFPTCLHIPVFAGNEEGLVKTYDHEGQPFHGVDGFNGIQHGRQADINLQSESAALGLIKLSQAHELYVVCFAPLTNIALAMKIDSQFAKRVKGFYAMGGNIDAIGNATTCAEFNFLADPEAAYVVLSLTSQPIILAPWELCGIDTCFTMEWRKNVLGSLDNEKVQFLNSIEYPWFDKHAIFTATNKWVPCDQIIMAIFLDDSCVVSKKKYGATIELQGEHTRGQMVIEKRDGMFSKANIDVVRQLDAIKVQNILLGSFTNSQ